MMNTSELLNELKDCYFTESDFEPKAYINGCALSKAQLVDILRELDIQATSDGGQDGIVQTEELSYVIYERDVYVSDGKYLDKYVLNAYIAAKETNIRKLAKKTGLSYPTVYNAVNGDGNPSKAATEKIAQALEIKI